MTKTLAMLSLSLEEEEGGKEDVVLLHEFINKIEEARPNFNMFFHKLIPLSIL